MSGMSRRDFLRHSLTVAGGASLATWPSGLLTPVQAAPDAIAPGQHLLPPLPYAADALRGLSAQLVTWHHGRHFAGYVKGRNGVEVALAALDPAAADFDLREYTGLKKQETFHASGQILHEAYFAGLGGDGQPGTQSLVAALKRDFGSVERWRADLKAAAHAAGIGWGVTAWDSSCRRLVNFTVESHQLGSVWGAVPVVALDAWEHAFYHDFGPEKGKYFEVFFTNLHWDRLEARFRAAGGS